MSPRPVLAVIPARGGSKGIAGKNLMDLGGLPLIAHSIRLARMCPDVFDVVVSTDSPEIADTARREGADVPFLRPAELATDQAAMWPVIRHALEAALAWSGRIYGSVLLLDPTSPGRLPGDVSRAIAMLDESSDADGVVGVSVPDFNPLWNSVIEDDRGWMRRLHPDAGRYVRRQDVPRVYRVNATLYLWRSKFVREREDSWVDGRHRLLEVPEERAIHIDEPRDLRKAELFLREGMIRFPWLEDRR